MGTRTSEGYAKAIGVVSSSAPDPCARGNAALCRFLGARKEDLIGTAIAGHVAPEDRDELSAALSKLVLGAHRAVHAEVRLPNARGGSSVEQLDLAASLYATRAEADGEGDDAIVLHVIDETEHRHLEVQLAQSQKMQDKYMDLISRIVRILTGDGETATTGVIYSDGGLIATCAHTIWSEKDRKRGLLRSDTVHDLTRHR